MSDLVLAFALVATVLVVTALVSGLVERSPLSFPLLFLGLGLLLGEWGFQVFELGPHDPILEIVGALTLSLVLFLDAVNLQITELRRRWFVPVLVLGPGTAIIIGLGALPLALLLGFSWVLAFIGGAVLASTDPVVLREITRDERIPRAVRQIMKIEAGMNDLVVLPIILVLIAVAQAEVGDVTGWIMFLARLLLLGPLIGFAIGGLGSWLMARADAAFYVRREYQALYGIGMVLAAYTAATAVGGDGFLGAFAAGLGVVILNQTLCDCFLEYGEVTAEMAMLLTFVLCGVVLSGAFESVPVGPALILAGLVIFVIRPAILGLVLLPAKMSREAHAFISWFGPRGLNSLLLMLLVVQADVAGAEALLGVIGVVVLASVTIHGATATPFTAWYGRRATQETLAEERESTAAGLLDRAERETPWISPTDLQELLTSPQPPIVLDVRLRSSFKRDGASIPGSVRVLPDQATEWAAEQHPDGVVAAYCT